MHIGPFRLVGETLQYPASESSAGSLIADQGSQVAVFFFFDM